MKLLVLKTFEHYLETWKKGCIIELYLYKDHIHYRRNSSREPDELILCQDRKSTGWFISREEFKDLLRYNKIRIIKDDM